MWQEIAAWQEQLHLRPDLSVKTVALYTQDARRFATWVQQEHPGLKVGEVTYAGPRVSEVAALQIPDVPVSARRGLLIIRRGKGLKHASH